MFENLYKPDTYGYNILTAQISMKLLLFAYVGTAIVAMIFAFFLWRRTRKLSSFYLFLMSLFYGVHCFFDLMTWISTARAIMFGWSVDNIFYNGIFIFSYWFLYSFIKNKDLPMWQKIASLATFIPAVVIAATNMQFDTYRNMEGIVLLNKISIERYDLFFEIFYVLTIASFAFLEYRKASGAEEKKKVALVGFGVFFLLSMFNFWGMISSLVAYYNFFGYGETSYYYNFQVYALFGMPILLAFLGYLIMKYQAFDLKPVKSVMLVIVLMLILFVSTFV